MPPTNSSFIAIRVDSAKQFLASFKKKTHIYSNVRTNRVKEETNRHYMRYIPNVYLKYFESSLSVELFYFGVFFLFNLKKKKRRRAHFHLIFSVPTSLVGWPNVCLIALARQKKSNNVFLYIFCCSEEKKKRINSVYICTHTHTHSH